MSFGQHAYYCMSIGGGPIGGPDCTCDLGHQPPMKEHPYVPHTFGLSCSIASELMDDDKSGVLAEIEGLKRWTFLREDILMGATVSNEDARWLIGQIESMEGLLKERQERPAPSMLDTARRWLASKIRPADDDNDEDY